MKRRIASILLMLSLLIPLFPGNALTLTVSAQELFEYEYTGYTGESTGVLDPELIQELKDTYFQPVVEDGTVINGGTPKGLIVLDVDTAIRYQYMEGFGASACWVGPNSDQWDEESLNKALLLMYSKDCGIGFVGYRHNIGGGSVGNLADKAETVCIEVAPGVYDTSVDAVNMAMLKKVAEIGATSIGLIYYSPPLRMTIAGVTSGNPDGGTNLKAECFQDYAEYVVGTAQAIVDEGIPVKYVSPFNEPAWGGTGYDPSVASQEHCYYTPDEVYDLSNRIAGVLDRENSSFGLAAAESPWWNITAYTTELLERFLENDTIMAHLDHFCAHSYQNTAAQKEGVSDLFLAHPEVSLHQTEECRKNTAFYNYEMIETARMAELLHEDFTILNITEWDFWCIADTGFVDREGTGGSLLEFAEDGTVYTPKRFWVAGQYSKFVTGTTRVEMAMPEVSGLFGTAYISDDENTITLVINNYSDQDQLISFEGLDGMMAKAYQTSDAYNLQYIGDVDATYGYSVPSMSVTTLVFEKSDKTGAYGTPTVEDPKTPVEDEPSLVPTIPEGAETVKVSIKLGAHYTVTPMVNKMEKGTQMTFTVSPKGGYSLEYVLVNGEEVAVDDYGRFTVTGDEDLEIKVKTYESSLYTLWPLLDFENFETGQDLIGTQGITYSNTYGSYAYNVQAHSNLIHDGQSLVFKFDNKDAPLYAQFPLAQSGGFTNWCGVQEIWAYVDTSQAKGQVSLQMSFIAQYYDGSTPTNEYNLFTLRSDNYTHSEEFNYYIMDENGEWVSTNSTRWGRALLPEGYTGWIRFPIGAFETDIQDRGPTNLFNVLSIGFAFDMGLTSGSKAAPVFIDTISLQTDPGATNYRSQGRPTQSITINMAEGGVIVDSDKGEDIPATDPSEQTPTDPSQNTQPANNSGATVIIIILIVVATAAAAIIILMPGKKKATDIDNE